MDSIDHSAEDSASRDTPVTLESYARLVARRWWLPLSFAVLGVSLALVYTGLQNVAYQARSTILLSPRSRDRGRASASDAHGRPTRSERRRPPGRAACVPPRGIRRAGARCKPRRSAQPNHRPSTP